MLGGVVDTGGNTIGDEAFVVGDDVFVGCNMLEKENNKFNVIAKVIASELR